MKGSFEYTIAEDGFYVMLRKKGFETAIAALEAGQEAMAGQPRLSRKFATLSISYTEPWNGEFPAPELDPGIEEQLLEVQHAQK